MPSQNPKHNKKRAVYQRKQTYSSYSGPSLRLILMGTIFVAVIAVVVVVILNLDALIPTGDNDEVFIEDGDSAMIHYKLWIDDDQDGIIEWVDVTPDQDSTFLPTILSGDSSGGLIPGFYNALLGMKVNDTNQFYLEANVDEDQDGIDDITGKDVVSYTGTHDLANTKLLFWLKVLDITKKGDTYTGTLPGPSSGILTHTIIETRRYFLDYLSW